MVLLIQALPLLVLVGLLGTGRATVVPSCLIALGLALLPAWVHVGSMAALPAFVAGGMMQGLWLAVVPVAIIAGGMVFHAAVSDRRTVAVPRVTTGRPADTLFTAAFLLGPFAEAVTGFGVGAVFALGMIRPLGVAAIPAVAMALVSQSVIPWGGLGPGTTIGAALAGVAAQDLSLRNAVQLAAAWPLMLMLFWWWCAKAGHAVRIGTAAAQMVWLLLVCALLVGLHRVLPWELAGLMATGPVLAVRLLWQDPPLNLAQWRRAGAAAMPYGALVAVLLGSRIWTGAPFWRPFADLPAIALNHAMFALWLVALLWLAGARHGGHLLRQSLYRARRPALALLLFVLLARLLSNADVPQALAAALIDVLGSAAPFAAPFLAGIAGIITGTNVGSNSALMPLQAALGRAAGLAPTVLPAVQNGTLFLMLSPQVAAIACGVAGDGATPAKLWRLAWPVFVISLGIGLAAVALG